MKNKTLKIDPVVHEIFPIAGDNGFAIVADSSIYGTMQEGEFKDFRVDVFPPGTDETFPSAFVSMQEPRMTPAEARIMARLLLLAADHAETLDQPAKASPTLALQCLEPTPTSQRCRRLGSECKCMLQAGHETPHRAACGQKWKNKTARKRNTLTSRIQEA